MPPESAAPAQPILSCRGLGKRFGAQRAALLEGVDLELRAGEYLAIVGESGVGKSTLLNLLCGLDRPSAGSVVLEGVDLAGVDDDAATLLRRRSVGFVFQAFHVLPYLSVAANVALPLALLGVPFPERERRTAAMLESVGVAALSARMPRELSGGELQRVAIARALVHRPRLVLADEPTGNLDARNAAVVLGLLRDQVKANAGAGILITHSRAAAQSADRILVLDAGGLAALPVG